LSIDILTLNPLKHFEGNLSLPLQSRLESASQWIELTTALGTKIVQVPSQFLEHSVGDDTLITAELQALADLAAQSSISIAYEAVAFGKFNFLWQDSLRIVEAVNRPNFGLCLDSFHIHARIWGDAYGETGILPNGPASLKESMDEFLKTCPKERVLYVQLSDASRFDPPLTDDSIIRRARDQGLAVGMVSECKAIPSRKAGLLPSIRNCEDMVTGL
jgi:4-hydroxyphenylpyruvate dioxygenase